MDSKAEQNIKKIGSSRRKFLKQLPGLVLGGYVGLKALEQGFYETLKISIVDPKINEGEINTLLRLSETAPDSENPNFRPMLDIIREGIFEYEGTTKKRVFYGRSPDYKNNDFYENIIKEYSSFEFLPRSPDKLVVNLISNFPKTAFEAYSRSSSSINTFDELFTSGNGFDNRFRKKHPEFIHKSGLYNNYDEVKVLMSIDAQSEIKRLKQKIEEECHKTEKPVSASFILSHFLELNEGDLSDSIFDTAVFLKFMARNDITSGKLSPGKDHVEWYKQFIRDEYQGPSYISSPKDEREINLIGKPYHSWNLVSMIKFLPVEVIRIGGAQRQLSTFGEQGLGKTRSDLQTLKDLKEIENMLLSYNG